MLSFSSFAKPLRDGLGYWLAGYLAIMGIGGWLRRDWVTTFLVVPGVVTYVALPATLLLFAGLVAVMFYLYGLAGLIYFGSAASAWELAGWFQASVLGDVPTSIAGPVAWLALLALTLYLLDGRIRLRPMLLLPYVAFVGATLLVVVPEIYNQIIFFACYFEVVRFGAR